MTQPEIGSTEADVSLALLAVITSELNWQRNTLITSLGVIESKLDQLLAKDNTIMADLAALETAVTDIKLAVVAAVAALNELAAANPNIQAEIDAITAALTSSTTDLSAAVAADAPPAP